MADAHDYLIRVLRDAYAVEILSGGWLAAQTRQLARWPGLSGRTAARPNETAARRTVLAGCLAEVGARPSRYANLRARTGAAAKRFKSAVTRSDAIAVLGHAYLFAYMEIALYTVAAAAAHAAGKLPVAYAREQMLAQERQMAYWVLAQLRALVPVGDGEEAVAELSCEAGPDGASLALKPDP